MAGCIACIECDAKEAVEEVARRSQAHGTSARSRDTSVRAVYSGARGGIEGLIAGHRQNPQRDLLGLRPGDDRQEIAHRPGSLATAKVPPSRT